MMSTGTAMVPAAMVTVQVPDKARRDKNDKMPQQPGLFKPSACQLSPAEQKLRFALDPLGLHMRQRGPSAPSQASSGTQRVPREQRLDCDFRAMSGVHYKFSSKLSYDVVTFHGHSISLGDLKRQIMARERLKVANCDLQILKAETSEEYSNDAQIPKNVSVIVRRVPARATNQKEPTPNLAEADAAEEDKIKAMMIQSCCYYEPFKTQHPQPKSPAGMEPPMKKGHHEEIGGIKAENSRMSEEIKNIQEAQAMAASKHLQEMESLKTSSRRLIEDMKKIQNSRDEVKKLEEDIKKLRADTVKWKEEINKEISQKFEDNPALVPISLARAMQQETKRELRKMEEKQEMRNAMLEQLVTETANELNEQDQELAQQMEAKFLQIQRDFEKLTFASMSLQKDSQQKQKAIEMLFQSLEKLQKEKADEQDMLAAIDMVQSEGPLWQPRGSWAG
ncbi:hypothetical protein IHE44_0007581 [Lamprotornis superbus]|uniref:DWNN domain-containing protein n=1 Tax=Lamprotornis superbus TaxID=245042 RepID=A0A835U169_9PASS|nr:hypothetical protein IHE44_0007581 [Lamprotornis superbus]